MCSRVSAATFGEPDRARETRLRETPAELATSAWVTLPGWAIWVLCSILLSTSAAGMVMLQAQPSSPAVTEGMGVCGRGPQEEEMGILSLQIGWFSARLDHVERVTGAAGAR